MSMCVNQNMTHSQHLVTLVCSHVYTLFEKSEITHLRNLHKLYLDNYVQDHDQEVNYNVNTYINTVLHTTGIAMKEVTWLS